MTTATAKTFDVTSAFDGTLIETLEYTSKGAAFQAMERAHGLYMRRSGWLPVAERIQILERFAGLVGERVEELCAQAAREGGKPWKDSMIEVERAIDGVNVAIRELASLHGTEIPMGLNASSAGRVAYTFWEPRGVVLAISAFNHPFNLIIHQAVTAIAAGCPVLLKPASTTPLSARSVVELLGEAGLPDGWCQLVLTENTVTEELVKDSRLAFMTFIGSARVGWHLRSKLSAGASCALEHGGVAPVIVDATADIEASIEPLVRGGFYHAGQVCVSVQRIYLHRTIAKQFQEAFVAAVEKLKTGDSQDPHTDVGPLIRTNEVDRVESWVNAAVEGGAKLLTGGARIGATTYQPTVLLDPSATSEISCKEVFGPVVALYVFDELDEAIERANSLDVFFQAALFTRDLETALSTSRRLNGMAVMVNDHTAFRVDWMPFGGHRQSGLGMGGIGHTIRDMSLERMVVMRSDGL